LHDSGRRWGDCAILYRTNAQSRLVEEYLMRVGIHYKVIGGTRFYDRREVKDALAYLKVAVNPSDEVSVKRVLNVPKRGIGESSVGRLDVYARSHGLTFFDVLREAAAAGVTGKALKGIDQFLKLMDELMLFVDSRHRLSKLRCNVLAMSKNSKPNTPSSLKVASKTLPSLLVPRATLVRSMNSWNR
jgi:DNA helicase-2/ATP-dependent DNA helicase PcrA